MNEMVGVRLLIGVFASLHTSYPLSHDFISPQCATQSSEGKGKDKGKKTPYLVIASRGVAHLTYLSCRSWEKRAVSLNQVCVERTRRGLWAYGIVWEPNPQAPTKKKKNPPLQTHPLPNHPQPPPQNKQTQRRSGTTMCRFPSSPSAPPPAASSSSRPPVCIFSFKEACVCMSPCLYGLSHTHRMHTRMPPPPLFTSTKYTCPFSLHHTDKSRLIVYRIGSHLQLRNFYGHRADEYSNPRCARAFLFYFLGFCHIVMPISVCALLWLFLVMFFFFPPLFWLCCVLVRFAFLSRLLSLVCLLVLRLVAGGKEGGG